LLRWKTEAAVQAANGDLEPAFLNARHHSFRQLTQGRAIY
jgi:hypothetical protein